MCKAPRTVAAMAVLSLSLACVAQAQDDKPTKTEKRQQELAAAQAQAASDETPAARQLRCWHLIEDNLHDTKNIDHQEQAMNALSEMPTNKHALELIEVSMKDPSMDVRTAAILAAGKVKSPWMVMPLHRALDDQEPQVVFAAATTLWKDYKDHTGLDILDAIVDGDRKANPGLMHGAEHSMSRTMHSPSTMARIGLTTGAGLLLGPFGFSVTAIKYMEANGADTARVQALTLLAEERTPAVREDLFQALADKDPGVRAAAAYELGKYHSPAYGAKIAPLVDDSKLPVRLSASAAYLNSMGGSTAGVKTHHKK